MIRAFLALPMPDVIRSALTVQQFLLPVGRKVPPETLHLTLVFLGDTAEPVLEEAHQGFAALRMAPFPLTLQGLGLFGGAKPHTVWAGAAPSGPLIRLQAKAERIARDAGCRVESRRFTPQVTLARPGAMGPDERLRLERAVGESPFRSESWSVEEMVLYRSTLGKAGSHYDELARYPLV
ncbi:MAG: RNA 2',3'-cyclic phosphodiesterase [Paracoccaceae bacterium]